MRFAALGSVVVLGRVVAFGGGSAQPPSQTAIGAHHRQSALLGPYAADLEQAGCGLRRLSPPTTRACLSRQRAALVIVILTSVNIWLISWAIQPGSISLLEVLAINPIIVFALLVVPAVARRSGRAPGLLCRPVSVYRRGLCTRHRRRPAAAVHRLSGEPAWWLLVGTRQPQSQGVDATTAVHHAGQPTRPRGALAAYSPMIEHYLERG